MGNVGYPASSFISQLKDNDIIVVEVSDHQLYNILDFKTNISESHIDIMVMIK